MIFVDANEFNAYIKKILAEAFEKGGELRIPTQALKSATVKSINNIGGDSILTIEIPLCFEGDRLNVFIPKVMKAMQKSCDDQVKALEEAARRTCDFEATAAGGEIE